MQRVISAKELYILTVKKLMQEGVEFDDARTLAKASTIVDGEIAINATEDTTELAQDYGLAQVGDKFYL